MLFSFWEGFQGILGQVNPRPKSIGHEILLPIQLSKVAREYLPVLLRHASQHLADVGGFEGKGSYRKICYCFQEEVNFSIRFCEPENKNNNLRQEHEKINLKNISVLLNM